MVTGWKSKAGPHRPGRRMSKASTGLPVFRSTRRYTGEPIPLLPPPVDARFGRGCRATTPPSATPAKGRFIHGICGWRTRGQTTCPNLIDGRPQSLPLNLPTSSTTTRPTALTTSPFTTHCPLLLRRDVKVPWTSPRLRRRPLDRRSGSTSHPEGPPSSTTSPTEWLNESRNNDPRGEYTIDSLRREGIGRDRGTSWSGWRWSDAAKHAAKHGDDGRRFPPRARSGHKQSST